MKAYQDLLRRILAEGVWQANRTSERSKFVSGAMLRFDLREGAPAVTTRKLAFKSFMGELVGFLRGADSAAQFRELGCRFWDKDANGNSEWLANPNRMGEDDLGRIYGVQWRRYQGFKIVQEGSPADVAARSGGWVKLAAAPSEGERGIVLFKEIDQLGECVRKLMTSPSSRRILFTGYNPAELDEMALPPCHSVPVQFIADVDNRMLDVCMYQRSADVALGVVGNLISTAALLTLIARLTGFTARNMTWFGGDVHIYENQLEMVETILSREPHAAPMLQLSDRIPDCRAADPNEAVEWLDEVEPGDFQLVGYEHHPAITAEMVTG